jgi:alpha-mannosidase
VLLNQFHDVLPGSSIEMVYVDAWAHYKDVLESGTALLQDAISSCTSGKGSGTVLYNTTSWPLPSSVISVEASIEAGGVVQVSADGKSKFVVSPLVEQFSSSVYDPSVASGFSPVSLNTACGSSSSDGSAVVGIIISNSIQSGLISLPWKISSFVLSLITEVGLSVLSN